MAENSLVLILFITFANALSTKNQTSKIQDYSNGTQSTLGSNYSAPFFASSQWPGGACCDSGCFVNCSSYSTDGIAPDDICYESSPPSLFDNEWCNSAHNDWWVVAPLFSGFEPSTRSYCYSLEAADFSSWNAKGDTSSIWSPTFTSPCCDLASCDLTVATANLIYWPTPAPVPNVTSIISNGFTFISPSAYVVFKDVAATNDCGLIGSAIASTTVAFAPSDLLMGEQAEDGTPIDYAQIPSSCPSSAPSYSADSYNLCFPSLVMPLQVFDMNPAWKNCNGDPTRGWILSGIMDPPRALIPTAALAPSPTKISNPSLSAAPASALLPPLAPVTDLPINSLPSPASKAQLVPENAEPTASHRIGDSNVLPQVDSPSQTIIESSSIQSQPRDSTQPPLSPDPQSGRDQPNLPLHNNGDPAKQASYVDPPPSPTGDGIGRLVSLQPLNNNDWGKGEPLNPATGSQPQQKPVLTLAGITYAADTASHFVIAGETLAPGSSINPFGTPVYLASDGVVAAVGSDLVKQTLITPISVQSTGRLIIAGATYTADSASHFIIAGQTLSQGGVITVSRTRIFLAIGGANAIVGTSTQVLVPISQELMLTFGGSLYTADAPSAFSIGSQVLTPGGAITISNTPVSLFPGGTIAVEGTNSQLLASIASPTPAPVLTLNAMPYTADQFSAFTIQGQTLTPGGSIIVSGTQISLAVGGNFAAIGTSIQLLTPAESTTKASVLTFEGTTYIADASSAFAIDVQALTTGGVITVDGTPLSLDIEGTAAIIGSSTQMLGTATITGSIAATIHLGAQTYTENTSGEFIISGQTLAKGGEITVSGTPVSFEGGGTGVVIGSSTEAVGVGGWIMSGLGPGAAPTGVMHFEGKGLKRRMNLKRVWGMMIAVEFCMLMN